MAIFKCKMCGGNLEVADGVSVCECDYCGTTQTLPTGNNEAIENLFNRANNLRLKGDFDKAEQIYEKIVDIDSSESEAYWGIVLCKYGIEYVEDPSTFKRVPTCHRTSYDAVTADADYIAAIEHADAIQRKIYESEAMAIDEIQKNILNIAKHEASFDVFICYKETDANGKRTVDSALANDIYYQLNQEGFKVFYAAITLEDKLGHEYEPYIFSALNSSKVMLVIGTRPENFESAWVKNEWSRFLKLIKTDRSKLLIPCYKDMEAYDLPEEFAHLQAQDMSKIGFINDLVRGIKKVILKNSSEDMSGTAAKTEPTVITQSIANSEPLLRRVFLFLEDGDWKSADEYCEKVLDIDPENAKAYLGKLMAELHVKKQADLKNLAQPFDNNNNFDKVIRFGDDELASSLKDCIAHINLNQMEEVYAAAVKMMQGAKKEVDFKQAAKKLETIRHHRDAEALYKECLEKADSARKDNIYDIACMNASHTDNIDELNLAIKHFEIIRGWRDSDSKIIECQKKIFERQKKLEETKAEFEYRAKIFESENIKGSKRKNIVIIISIIAVVCIFALIFTYWQNIRWNNIIEISVGNNHTVGLKRDGKVLARGNNEYGQCDVKDWKDIDAISAGGHHTIGLKTDGLVVAIGSNKYGQCNVLYWTDIISVSAGWNHTVGVKSDGTVVAVGNNEYGQCDIQDWTGITAVSAGKDCTIGLNSYSMVVAVGNNALEQCNVQDWMNITAISAGAYHTVGLKSDGTVVATGWNGLERCDVQHWTGIVAVSAGEANTVGLKYDGTIVGTE